MTPIDEPDPAAADLARRRREVAMRLHPDRGGDPEAFVAAMAELDALAGAPVARRPPGQVVPEGRPAVRVTWRGRVRRLRRRVARRASRRRFIDVTPPSPADPTRRPPPRTPQEP